MELQAIASLLPYILTAYDQISRLIVGAKSNEDVVTKIGNMSPQIAEFMKWVGSTLFPQVNPQLQDAAAALTIFGKEFVKSAQMTLNIVSPLIGLPAPNLEVDGVSGKMTQAATKAVQEALATKGFKGVIADGFYGFKTRDVINEFLAQIGGQAKVQPA